MKLQKKILIQSLAIAGVCVSMASFVVEAASPAPNSLPASDPASVSSGSDQRPPVPPAPSGPPGAPISKPIGPPKPPDAPGVPGTSPETPSPNPPFPKEPPKPDHIPPGAVPGAVDPHHGDPGTSGSGGSSAAGKDATGGTNSGATGTATGDKDKGTSTSNKDEADSHNKDNTSNSDATSATTENTPKGDDVTGKDTTEKQQTGKQDEGKEDSSASSAEADAGSHAGAGDNTTEKQQTGKQDEGKEDSSASSAETDAGSHAGADNPKGLSDGSTNTSSSATVETPKEVAAQPVNTNSMVPFAFAERDALLVSYDMIGTYFERQGRVIDAQHDKAAWGRLIVSLPTVKARHQAGTYTSTLLGGQVGVDLWHTFNRHAGVSLALLSGDDELDNLAGSAVVNSLGRLNNMDITSRYIGLGAYFGADHLSHNAYYDIVVQYVMGQQKHQMVKLKSKGWHVSAETGLQVAQWNNLSVDLSGQLVYSNVSFSKAESAHVKGLRAFGNVQLNYDTHTAFKPFVKVGVYTDLIKPTYHKVQFDRAGWQIGFGADSALSDTSQLYLKLNYRRSFGGLEQGFKGIVGYKKAF